MSGTFVKPILLSKERKEAPAVYEDALHRSLSLSAYASAKYLYLSADTAGMGVKSCNATFLA